MKFPVLRLSRFLFGTGLLACLACNHPSGSSSAVNTPASPPGSPPAVTIVASYGTSGAALVAAGNSLYASNGTSFTFETNTPNQLPISSITPFDPNGDAYVAAGGTLYLFQQGGIQLSAVGNLPAGQDINLVTPVGAAGAAYVTSGANLYQTYSNGSTSSLQLVGAAPGAITDLQAYDSQGYGYAVVGSALYQFCPSVTPVFFQSVITPNGAPITQILVEQNGETVLVAAGSTLYSYNPWNSAMATIGSTSGSELIVAMTPTATQPGAYFVALAASTSSNGLSAQVYTTDGASITNTSTPNLGSADPTAIKDFELISSTDGGFFADGTSLWSLSMAGTATQGPSTTQSQSGDVPISIVTLCNNPSNTGCTFFAAGSYLYAYQITGAGSLTSWQTQIQSGAGADGGVSWLPPSPAPLATAGSSAPSTNVAFTQLVVVGNSPVGGIYYVTAGASYTIQWQTVNATSMSSDTSSFCGAYTPSTSGICTINTSTSTPPDTDTAIVLTAYGPGGPVSQVIQVEITGGTPPPPEAPTITSFTAPSSVYNGQFASLAWTTRNATSVTISPAISNCSFATSGSCFTDALTANTTFTLTASGPGGSVSQSVAVTVIQQTYLSFYLDNPLGNPSNGTFASGQSVVLVWSAVNATALTLTPTPESLGATCTLSLSTGNCTIPNVTSPITFNMTASGTLPSMTVSQTVVLAPLVSAPTVPSFTATPNAITAGQPVTLAWQTSNATSVAITPSPASLGAQCTVGLSGSCSIPSLASNTTFTLTATGEGGTTTQTCAVAVSPSLTVLTGGFFTGTPSGYGATQQLYYSSGTAITDIAAMPGSPGAFVASGSGVFFTGTPNGYGATQQLYYSGGTALTDVATMPGSPGAFVASGSGVFFTGTPSGYGATQQLYYSSGTSITDVAAMPGSPGAFVASGSGVFFTGTPSGYGATQQLYYSSGTSITDVAAMPGSPGAFVASGSGVFFTGTPSGYGATQQLYYSSGTSITDVAAMPGSPGAFVASGSGVFFTGTPSGYGATQQLYYSSGTSITDVGPLPGSPGAFVANGSGVFFTGTPSGYGATQQLYYSSGTALTDVGPLPGSPGAFVASGSGVFFTGTPSGYGATQQLYYSSGTALTDVGPLPGSPGAFVASGSGVFFTGTPSGYGATQQLYYSSGRPD